MNPEVHLLEVLELGKVERPFERFTATYAGRQYQFACTSQLDREE